MSACHCVVGQILVDKCNVELVNALIRGMPNFRQCRVLRCYVPLNFNSSYDLVQEVSAVAQLPLENVHDSHYLTNFLAVCTGVSSSSVTLDTCGILVRMGQLP